MKSVGSLRENHLLSKVFNDRIFLESPVSDVMDKSFRLSMSMTISFFFLSERLYE